MELSPQLLTIAHHAMSFGGNEILLPNFKEELIIKDKRVSSKTLESLYASTMVNAPLNVTTDLHSTGDLYFYATEGRGAGKPPPIAPLKEWARLRGLETGIAYAVQKTIAKYGTNPKYHQPTTTADATQKALPKLKTHVSTFISQEFGTVLVKGTRGIYEAL